MPLDLEEKMSRMAICELQALESKLNIPTRPSPGVEGKGVRLYANYFEITSLPVGEIVQYDVVITPDVPRALKRGIFNKLEADYRQTHFGGKVVAYDGQHNLYSLGPLPKSEYTLEVTLPERSGRPGRSDRVFQVKLRQVSSVNAETIKKFLDGKLSYTPYDVITSLEVILRHPLVQTNIVVGRSLYNEEGATRISGGLEVWKGYFQSIRPGSGRLLLNVDTTATAFYSASDCFKLVEATLRVRPGDAIGKLNEQETRQIEQLLRGVKIQVTHRQNTTRRYRVLGLTTTPANATMFETENGKVSVAQYFEQKYDKKLKEPALPCLVVGSKEKSVYLPIECCMIPSGQRYIRKLNEEQTSDMIKIANQHPETRFDTISKSPRQIQDVAEYLKQFNMSFGNQLVQVNGRVLKTPTVFYSKQSQEPDCVPAFGAWNLKGKKVEQGATIESWAVCNFAKVRDDEIDAFVRELCITCTDTGVPFKAQRPPVVHAQSDIVRSVESAFEAAKNTFGRPAHFVLVILPSTDSYLYGEVKRTSDTMVGLPTQCMQVKHLRRPNKQYCANLALKINVKCGGVNASLGKQLGFIVERPTMVLGADVTHPGIGEKEKPSIAAVVASMDIKLSRYAANVRVQDSRQEIIVDIREMVKEHIESFCKINNIRPQRILFYRDGVSEGQFAQVLEFELAQIKAGCKELDPAYQPTITMILVQKRHHTRFIPVESRDADRSGNIPAGTVVDTGICHPTQFDFFLCSHAGIQGTSRAAHYHVVYDDHRFTADAIQTLSYNMCFTFARCTRSVSIVTPAYYAHLVAFRARFHFPPTARQDIKSFCQVVPSLQRGMYFI